MALEKQKADVLVIGELNVDLIFNQVEAFPELGKEKIANNMNFALGGSSAIFASNIARLGSTVTFCGMIGNDEFGDKIISQMDHFGVDTSHIIISEKFKTGLTTAIRRENDRAMLTYPGSMIHFLSTIFLIIF